TRFSRDWSSDVCSSDLTIRIIQRAEELTITAGDGLCGTQFLIPSRGIQQKRKGSTLLIIILELDCILESLTFGFKVEMSQNMTKIGRASCRERVKSRCC